MIEFAGVTKRFGSTAAVDSLDLKVEKGEIFGFLGPNGAGKTTTVKLLTGLLRPSSGTITVAGLDVVEKTVEAKRKLGLVPDEPFVYPKLTGVEFLRFVGDLYGVALETQRKRIPELLAMFELSHWGGELAETYSHGMRQKLVIAANLLHEPEVLVLDEPLVGLDPKSAKLVKEIFQTLSDRGCTLFMCTHVLEIAERLCDRIGIMIQGRLTALGTVSELRRGKDDARLAGPPGSPDEARHGGAPPPLEDIFLELTGGAEYASLLKHL